MYYSIQASILSFGLNTRSYTGYMVSWRIVQKAGLALINFFNPIRSRLFCCLNVQEGIIRDPPEPSGSLQASSMKLSTVIELLKAYQNT